jgi:hypothetical protein
MGQQGRRVRLLGRGRRRPCRRAPAAGRRGTTDGRRPAAGHPHPGRRFRDSPRRPPTRRCHPLGPRSWPEAPPSPRSAARYRPLTRHTAGAPRRSEGRRYTGRADRDREARCYHESTVHLAAPIRSDRPAGTELLPGQEDCPGGRSVTRASTAGAATHRARSPSAVVAVRAAARAARFRFLMTISFMSVPEVPDLAVHVNILPTSVTSFADTGNLRQRRHPGRAGPASACAVVTSACAGGGVLAGRSGPGRSRAPAVTAPAAKMPAVHQNAVS